MLLLYIITTVVVATSYIGLNLFILYHWLSDKQKESDNKLTTNYKYSIIIPVRNEEKVIRACIDSILSNLDFDFNRLEIIVVDDFSTDDTKDIVGSIAHPAITLVSLEDYVKTEINAYKKAAVSVGQEKSTGDYIIQIDGDVVVSNFYLKTVDDFVSRSKAPFIAAPVLFSSNGSVFENFQALDFLGMMAVTQSGIHSGYWHMANGANMIYKKADFSFDLNDGASGDDVFAIQTIARSKASEIMYLKSISAAVTTAPPKDLKSFVSQRLRWATKNKNMRFSMMLMMGIPFGNAILMIIHLPLMLVWGKVAAMAFLAHYIFKSMTDYILLSTMADFYKKEKILKSFIPASFIHTWYISTIGLLSLFKKKYNWKGRKVY